MTVAPENAPTSWLDRCLFGALVLLLIASTLNGLRFDTPVLGHSVTIRPDQLAVIPLLVLLAVVAVRRRAGWARTPADWPVLGLVLANAAASAFVSPDKSMSLQGVVLLALYALMMSATFRACTHRPTWASRGLWVCLAIGVAQIAYGLIAFVAHGQGLDLGGVQIGQVIKASVSVRSTFYEANLYAIYLAVVGVFFVVAALAARSLRNRLLACAVLVPLSVAMILTMTRSAWLAFAAVVIGLVIATAFGTRNWRARLGRLSLVVLAIALVGAAALWVVDPILSRMWKQPQVLAPRVASLLNLVHLGRQPGATSAPPAKPGYWVEGSSTSGISGRATRYELGLRLALERPVLGHGTFAGEAIHQRYWISSIVQAAYDTGLVGVLFLVWMYVAVIVSCWRAFRRSPPGRMRNSLLGAALANALLFVTSQFTSFLWVGFPWVFMGLTLGLVAQSRTANT